MKRLLTLLMVLFLATPLWATNTISTSVDSQGKLVTIQIIPDGSTAWNSVATYATGLSVAAILFKPSAASDHLMIRDVNATGNAIFDASSIDGGSLVLYVGRRIKPYLLQTDCTFGTPANVKIIFILQ